MFRFVIGWLFAGGVRGKPVSRYYLPLFALILKRFIRIVGNIHILVQALLPRRILRAIGGQRAPHEAYAIPSLALILHPPLLPPLRLHDLILDNLHGQLIEPILPTKLDCNFIGIIIISTSMMLYLIDSN